MKDEQYINLIRNKKPIRAFGVNNEADAKNLSKELSKFKFGAAPKTNKIYIVAFYEL
jgi:hypothetical protein